MKNKKIRCYVYIRVSTTMQVDGYSLDAQREKLRKYAEYQNMEIIQEFSDEGKSGKSVEGRPEFQRMLDNIENGIDDVQFVLVFKLSRFGRNAADVLSSLQRMQDFGVNLICVEDGIDSSKDSGKLMISVLSAVAEIERENILVQTMEGRKQKAREGKWNGGFAPYGYELINGELQIAEDEAEIIRLIYDKFIHTNMGIAAIATWLNQHGYKKKKRQNNTLDAFAASFVKGVLDNPVYCGKLAYGRRKNEKVSGTRNEYRIVKQENYMLHDGIHDGIISETDWELAHQKREKTGVKYEKIHSLDHEHILSGILKCPLCGSGMYGNVNRKKRKDGTLYKDYFYYACKHRRLVDGHKCGYHKQWNEDKINNAVEEVIRKLVQNPKFEEAIRKKIGSRIDTAEIEKEIENLEKQHRQLTGAKSRLGQQMDSLDITDRFYEKKYQDMETRLYRLYDEIEGVENSINEVKNRLLNIKQKKISEENVYQFLLYFDKLYDKFTDVEKKEFLNSFVEQVDIYEQEQADGRFLKHIKFRFPVYFNNGETTDICWDNESTVEKDTLLEKKATDTKGTLTFDSDLPHGKYYVKEEVRKAGYLPNEEVWNVDATYENQNLAKIELNKEVENQPTETRITKTDATTGNELEGAKLQVIDKDGNVVEEWVSSKEEHVIYGLPEGSYTLHEELAPYEDGYVSASDVTFEVKEDGSVTKVEMKDEYSKVEISKTDLTTGKELEGAKLQIIRKDGTVLEEWITDGKPHSVEKLPVNEELTLREITAPDGYEIAEDVTFTLKDTMEVQKVEMKDARTPEKTTEKTNAPKTGDNQKIWAFVLLALASAGTATGVTVYRRKKSKMTDNKKETEEK